MIKDCHVGIKGIVFANNQCLVLQKGFGDDAFWEVPGGRIDDTETLHETLKRELREELPTMGGFSIGELAGAYRLNRDLEGERALVLIFYTVETEMFEIVLSAEHSDYKWISKETLSELQNGTTAINDELYGLLKKVLS